MKAAEKLTDLVNALPNTDKSGLLSEIDRESVDKTMAAIEKRGREGVVELVGMLIESGKGDDLKPRYALHVLAVRAGGQGEERRRAFAEALASTLGGDRPKELQAFVVRQLQVAGGKEVAAKLGALLPDADLSEYAAQALLAIRAGAVEQFRAALPRVAGKQRVTVVQALGVLRDGASAEALKKLASDADSDTRQTARWALANAGVPAAVDVLIRATNTEGQERTQAAKACLLLGERLAAAGKKTEATRLYDHLRGSYSDPTERHVHDAATRGLAALKNGSKN
ncbi:MAG TPA: HEAT repeat domain-containing protein [Gemmataceae bacterium]|jgi:HEAT repeat protein